jgi:hypothetical protein
LVRLAHLHGGDALRFRHTFEQQHRRGFLALKLGHLKSDELFDPLEQFHVVLGDESHGTTGTTCASRATHAMDVIFRMGRDVVVDHEVHRGNVESS